MKKSKKSPEHTPVESRGIDRVPEHLRDEPRPVVFIHQPPKPKGLFFRPAAVTPYRNPDRVARLAKNGRLRKELRS